MYMYTHNVHIYAEHNEQLELPDPIKPLQIIRKTGSGLWHTSHCQLLYQCQNSQEHYTSPAVYMVYL